MANRDYKHGINQYYQELLSCNSLDNIFFEIKSVYSTKIKHYEKCFCGSYKKCHSFIHNKLIRLPKERIEFDYKLITQYKKDGNIK